MPTPERRTHSRRTLLAGIAGVALVGVSTAGAVVFNRDDTASAGSATPVASAAVSSAPVSSAAAPSPAAPATSGESESTSASTSSSSSAGASSSSSAASTSSSKASTSSAATSSAKAAGTYKDGKYTETADYDNPEGGASITVTVTLADDVITATSATGSESSGGPSAEYQNDFISGYASEVVGKDIDSVSLSRVSGSSLTSNGFNAALTKIKTDAKS